MQLFLFALLLSLYYALHSLLALESIKAIITRRVPKRWYRLVYNGVALITLLPVYVGYKQIVPTELFQLPALVHYAGWGVSLLGLLVLLLSVRQYPASEFLGFAQLETKAGAVAVDLNTRGLNALVRHPLYTGIYLIVWGLFLWRATDAAAVMAGITSLYLWIGSRLEEQKLVGMYGEAYRRYRERVPAFFPLRFWKTPEKQTKN